MTQPGVRVVVDFRHPAAYLAIEPTRALEARLGRHFDWLPISLPPLPRPAEARPDEDRGARHRRVRAEYVAADLRRYAADRGLELGDLHRDLDTTAASVGLLWLRHVAPEAAGAYVARMFDLVWREGGDADDAAAVTELLGEHSEGFAAFASDEGPAELEALQARLVAEGVWKVPGFVLDGELYAGREHLPMVERLAGLPGR